MYEQSFSTSSSVLYGRERGGSRSAGGAQQGGLALRETQDSGLGTDRIGPYSESDAIAMAPCAQTVWRGERGQNSTLLHQLCASCLETGDTAARAPDPVDDNDNKNVALNL